jgi:hypothetical protein
LFGLHDGRIISMILFSDTDPKKEAPAIYQIPQIFECFRSKEAGCYLKA